MYLAHSKCINRFNRMFYNRRLYAQLIVFSGMILISRVTSMPVPEDVNITRAAIIRTVILRTLLVRLCRTTPTPPAKHTLPELMLRECFQYHNILWSIFTWLHHSHFYIPHMHLHIACLWGRVRTLSSTTVPIWRLPQTTVAPPEWSTIRILTQRSAHSALVSIPRVRTGLPFFTMCNSKVRAHCLYERYILILWTFIDMWNSWITALTFTVWHMLRHFYRSQDCWQLSHQPIVSGKYLDVCLNCVVRGPSLAEPSKLTLGT